jgi:hypothetical protein
VVVELVVAGLLKNPDPKMLFVELVVPVVFVVFVVFPDPELDAVFSGVGRLKMLMLTIALKEVAVQESRPIWTQRLDRSHG